MIIIIKDILSHLPLRFEAHPPDHVSSLPVVDRTSAISELKKKTKKKKRGKEWREMTSAVSAGGPINKIYGYHRKRDLRTGGHHVNFKLL